MLHIFTSHVSRTDLLVLQLNSILRHVKCPHRVHVVNDASDEPNIVEWHERFWNNESEAAYRTKVQQKLQLLEEARQLRIPTFAHG